jgi:hypothetical protein
MHLSSLVSWIGATSRPTGEPIERVAFHRESKLEVADKTYLRDKLESLRDHLSIIGGDVTLLAVDELIDRARYDWVTWGYVKDRLGEINNTLRREISTKTLLVLEARDQAYFAPKVPHFGNEVATKFPTGAAFEIDEAAKCLALGRPTAAVFHLMRVMEIGIRAVARCLGITDPIKPAERNWGHILKSIKDDLAAHGGKSPDKAWAQAGEADFFDGAHVSLDAVRVAWRNPTMHVEKKYTDDEAEHVFGAVRGFMTKLASRCDENGLPLA